MPRRQVTLIQQTTDASGIVCSNNKGSRCFLGELELNWQKLEAEISNNMSLSTRNVDLIITMNPLGSSLSLAPGYKR